MTAIVADLGSAARAMERLLGTKPSADVAIPGADIRSFRVGEAEVHVLAPTGPGPIHDFHAGKGGGFHHLALGVDALDDALAALDERGFRAMGEPVETAPGLREVFLDPQTTGGLLIQIVERRTPRPEAGLDPARIANLVSQGAGKAPWGDLSEEELRRTYRVEHHVPVGDGRALHVTETFTSRAFLRAGPRRAMVMLPGPMTRGDLFNIDVPGYDAGAIMAERGFFAYAIDFEGHGASTRPTDGRSTSVASQVTAVREVVRYIQRTRGVPRVDLLGESWGGGIAAELARDPSSVRSCTLASMIYRTPSAQAAAEAGPPFRAFLESQPDGYLETVPPIYEALVAGSPPVVAERVRAAQPGRYPIGPLLDFFRLPFVDPSGVAVPLLILHGADDPRAMPSDHADLAAAAPTSAAVKVVVIEGGGHVPRIETAPRCEAFWRAVLQHVDPAA